MNELLPSGHYQKNQKVGTQANALTSLVQKPVTPSMSHSVANNAPVLTLQRANCRTLDMIVKNDSQSFLPANNVRSYLFIRNKSLLDVFVSFGQSAESGRGERISAGGFFEPAHVPINEICLWSAGNASVCVIEGSPQN